MATDDETRDMFAAQLAAALVGKGLYYRYASGPYDRMTEEGAATLAGEAEALARHAYMLADAMMAERARRLEAERKARPVPPPPKIPPEPKSQGGGSW